MRNRPEHHHFFRRIGAACYDCPPHHVVPLPCSPFFQNHLNMAPFPRQSAPYWLRKRMPTHREQHRGKTANGPAAHKGAAEHLNSNIEIRSAPLKFLRHPSTHLYRPMKHIQQNASQCDPTHITPHLSESASWDTNTLDAHLPYLLLARGFNSPTSTPSSNHVSLILALLPSVVYEEVHSL